MTLYPSTSPPPQTTAIYRDFKKSTAISKGYNVGLRYIELYLSVQTNRGGWTAWFVWGGGGCTKPNLSKWCKKWQIWISRAGEVWYGSHNISSAHQMFQLLRRILAQCTVHEISSVHSSCGLLSAKFMWLAQCTVRVISSVHSWCGLLNAKVMWLA